MRVLIHANGPHVSTGYGVQCRYLASHLVADGHDVAVSCTYGQQGAVGQWRIPGTNTTVPLYPVGYEVNGNDILHMHALHHFQGDDHGGWLIPILDVWALQNPVLGDFQIAAWTPVDHIPTPPAVLDFFKRTDAVPVAMSRFGERLLFEAGLAPTYIPLSVDTTVYQPTPVIRGVTARELLKLPADAFVVGMVAMNKGWSRDRKGFNEAFHAFGLFLKDHPNAILYMHAEKFGGAEGIDLVELAAHRGIPDHAIRWVDQYAYRLGIPAEMMAATYTAFDVLLAPSHGEGFCVPLIEAQACGTPVIATDFSAQTELVGAGWLVSGQMEWDPSQHASYVCPNTGDVLAKLEEAYAADLVAMQRPAIEFAAQYDTKLIFENYWRPFLASLDKPIEVVSKPPMQRVNVIVPTMRWEHRERLMDSFDRANDGTGHLILLGGPESYADKVNKGLECEPASDWVCIVGDDCEFTPGFIEAARKLSDRFDVIGTNDSLPGRVRNPDVAAGRHADHFFVRRSYIDELGASLDGPGILAPTCYGHWFVDREIIELAKARGVFTPCLESVIVHHHPGYDGAERDDLYKSYAATAAKDQQTWLERAPLVAMQRVGRR